jgi:hypothetical protein
MRMSRDDKDKKGSEHIDGKKIPWGTRGAEKMQNRLATKRKDRSGPKNTRPPGGKGPRKGHPPFAPKK